jgi:hypothetical protein
MVSRGYQKSRPGRTNASPSMVRRAAKGSRTRSAIEHLQLTAGNTAVLRMLSGSTTGRIRPQKSKAIETTFEDCPKNAKVTIDQATATARGWVSYAIKELDAVLANPAKADPNVDALLRKHFQIGKGKRAQKAFEDVGTVRKRFAKLQRAFAGELPFECEKSCPKNWHGYVRDYWIFGQGDIHVCPPFFAASFQSRVHTIIHEMGHKFADMDDNAYRGNAARPDAEYLNLSTSAAMNNADSYASFAEEV